MTTAPRIGVVLVHGVGSAAHSDTLIDFGESIIGWVARWQRAHGREPHYGPTRLNFAPLDDGSAGSIPYTTLHVPIDPDGEATQTWVVAEAWWASSIRALGFQTMLSWSLRYLLSLVFYLFWEMVERLKRTLPQFATRHDGKWWYRFADAAAALGHLVAYAIIGPIGYLVLVPLIVLAQIPIPALQTFIVVTLIKQFLQYNAADLRVYYEDEIQAANMRRRVADAIAWLVKPEAEGGGGCESVRIVAHSGGSWVAHGMLTDPEYAVLARRVRKFITLGNGQNKIWQVSPSSIERLSRPIKGNIYWVDFWGSYDPVPAGWLRPPRLGPRTWSMFLRFERDNRPWRTIYDPDPAVAMRHDLHRRPDPKPRPTRARGGAILHRVDYSPEARYWPESVRVVNRMDALTDHGGYFTNDEEVLRRVAGEIQSELYSESIFWGTQKEALDEAVKARRDRVGVLAIARVIAVVIALWAVHALAVDIAAYIVGVSPLRGVLDFARETYRLLSEVPRIGPWMAEAWLWLVVFASWVVGAAVASLVGLAPYGFFRSRWEAHDAAARKRLLRRALAL